VAVGAPPRDDAYFVVVGTIEPRKNHLLLLDVWDRLVAKLGNAAPTLVVIGQRGWECENVVARLERSAGSGRVVELPRCSDAELGNYLHHARALLFPTFVEGYGMPLVEALVAGVPGIASDLGVFREVAGDVPEYADPSDADAWEALVIEYAAPGSARRAAQLQRLARFESPTWDAHFAQVDTLLGELDA
jgi:glycosyltransferase involved in cell wall biosynthesis